MFMKLINILVDRYNQTLVNNHKYRNIYYFSILKIITLTCKTKKFTIFFLSDRFLGI